MRICELQYCSEKHFGKGYCNGHYKQMREGRGLTPLFSTTKKHGMYKTSEYNSWTSMRQRVNDKNCPAYALYGAQGITISDEWNDFTTFYADMGKKPSPKHSLDRIDPYGNYCKENCRWANHTVQAINKKAVITNESGHRGVVRVRGSNKWLAQIYYNGKNIRLGLHTDLQKAIDAREAKEKQIFELNGIRGAHGLQETHQRAIRLAS